MRPRRPNVRATGRFIFLGCHRPSDSAALPHAPTQPTVPMADAEQARLRSRIFPVARWAQASKDRSWLRYNLIASLPYAGYEAAWTTVAYVEMRDVQPSCRKPGLGCCDQPNVDGLPSRNGRSAPIADRGPTGKMTQGGHLLRVPTVCTLMNGLSHWNGGGRCARCCFAGLCCHSCY